MDLSAITWRKARGSANDGSCVEVGIWHTSSYSTSNGGQCVEIGAWQKSSHSGEEGNCIEVGTRLKDRRSGQGGHCVEVAAGEAVILARDSKDPDGPVLGFRAEAWGTFLATVKSGHLDLL